MEEETNGEADGMNLEVGVLACLNRLSESACRL